MGAELEKIMGDSIIARRIKSDGREQLLASHANNVAVMASRFAEKFGVGKLAAVVGKYHDLGKIKSECQERIRGNDDIYVPHSIYGAMYIYEVLKSGTSLPVAEMLANCIVAHHGELQDFLPPSGDVPFPRWKPYCNTDSDDNAVSGKSSPSFDDLGAELKDALDIDSKNFDAEKLSAEFVSIYNTAPDKAFALSMLTKLVYSCLVDADRFDAYLFESGEAYDVEKCVGKPDWKTMLSRLEQHIDSMKKDNTALEMVALRKKVSTQCAESGLRECGIYQLEVPTGGGKTLASLRFAINHAQKHKMSRIIYVTPYLSITEQTANVIRKCLCLDVNDSFILEHHSNVVPDDAKYYKLQIDRWDTPIIITTQVQFLESVFSARGSDLRKLHNMADSVIIFDEAQSLPIKCIHIFNSAINFLHKVCKSTVLLCTATQPLLDKVERPILLSDKPSIADCGAAPVRYKIVNALRSGGYSFPDLAEFVIEKHNKSTLIIVNTKETAKKLVIELKNKGVQALHLSTNMCPAHREAVMEDVRSKLETEESVVCVSTQLIEAGVDISFECVIRDLAGLDSIYQAAGRCNRHGECGCVKNVFVINVKGENLDRLPEIKIGAEITQHLFDENVLDINVYYEHYFYARKDLMDYPIDGSSGSIYDLLSKNEQGVSAFKNRNGNTNGNGRQVCLRSAIHTAAEKFFVIDPGQKNVVVPYDEDSVNLVEKYVQSKTISEKRKHLRDLGKYMVSLYKFHFSELEKHAALVKRVAFVEKEGIYVLSGGFYHKEFGVDLDGSHEFLYL